MQNIFRSITKCSLLVLGIGYLSSCGKKGPASNPPPVDTTTTPVVITDQPDNGKDTTGNWQQVYHTDVEGYAAWSQLLFPAKDTAYLVNSAWLPTSAFAVSLDGGKTWSDQHFMVANNEFLDMIDGTTGLGYRKSLGTTYGSDVDAVYWSPAALQYDRDVYNATGIGGLQVTGVSIPSRDVAYVTFVNGQSVRLDHPFNSLTYVFNSAADVPVTTTDIFFADNATGWLCTSDGYIAATTDSSIAWNLQLSAVNTGFSKIYFIDDQTGWAASYTNSFYQTTDGGKTWNKMAAPGITSRVVQFVFTSKTRGFFIAGREVYETFDGGSNWRRSCKMGTENFQSITKQGSTAYVLSQGSESRTTQLSGGGTETATYTHATILSYQ